MWLWPTVSVLGFLVVTAGVIAMARSSTARWERAKRAPRATRPVEDEHPSVPHLAAELLHVALERTADRARHTLPPAVSRALAAAPGHRGERHPRSRPAGADDAPAPDGVPAEGDRATARGSRGRPPRAAGSGPLRRGLPGSLTGRLAHWHPHWHPQWHPHWPHRRSAPSPGTDDHTPAT